MAQEEIDYVKYKRTVIEEHVVLVQEPESHYVGHFTPASGSAAAITSGMFNFLQTNSISTDDIVAVGCDGTAVNTGRKGGIIHMVEVRLQRPVQPYVYYTVMSFHCDTLFHALPKFGPEKCLAYLRLPWLGSVFTQFEKQVKSAVKQCFSAVKPRVAYFTNELLSSTNKDVLPALQKSNAIYQF